jgi:ABC-type nitrate/sulfonate/bicarbonate transport system substrate-binding protein
MQHPGGDVKKFQSSMMMVGAIAAMTACATDSTGPAAPLAARGDATAAVAPDTIDLGYFSFTPQVAIAQKNGYFAAENLVVREFVTPSSPAIFTALRDGHREIILTQIDNVFNYRLNASNPIGGTFDAVAFMGQDRGNGASLVARAGITSFEQLRGDTVSVDSPNSGFAFVLYGIMRAHGLEKGVDYTVVTTGGTPFRYNDLIAGKHAATILNAGYQFRAEQKGLKRLGEIADAQDPFMGSAAVARRSWLDANPDVAVRFISAFQRAADFILDPANKSVVIAILIPQSGNDPVVAEKTYQTLVSPTEGIIDGGDIHQDWLFGTASLRNAFGGFDEEQNLSLLKTPAGGVYDLSLVRAARKAAVHAEHAGHDEYLAN